MTTLKEFNFGTEIETTGITRKHAAEIIAQYYETVDEGIQHRSSYNAYVVKDAKGREWKCVTDASIENTSSCFSGGCEVVTPILQYDDIEDLQQIIRELRKAGAVANSSCGIHVHVGVERFTAQNLRNIVNIVASKESLIYKALQVSDERRARWCKPVEPSFIRRLNEQKPTRREELADIWYAGYSQPRSNHYHTSRYHGLNLHATFSDKGTVEFRLFNGTLHAGKIKAYIQFCLAVVNQAMNQKKATFRHAPEGNDKYTFRCWLLRLGLIGDEFKTCRTHMLANLTGNSAWRVQRVA